VRQWPAACSSAAGSGASAGSPWSTFARSWMTVTQGGRKPPALPGDQRDDRRRCQTPVNSIYIQIQHAARQVGITAQDLRANRTQHEAHASAGRDNQRSYAKIRPGQRRLDDNTAETSALRQALSNPLAGATERPCGCGKDGDSGWPRLAPERRFLVAADGYGRRPLFNCFQISPAWPLPAARRVRGSRPTAPLQR
jgi:hypothetical protein